MIDWTGGVQMTMKERIEYLRQQKTDKEKAEREKAEKEKADKEKADKEKVDKEKGDKVPCWTLRTASSFTCF